MNLFQEISRTNSVLCRSLGLPSDTYDRPLADAEVNGSPLSPAEVEIAEAAVFHPRKAKHLKHWPRTGVQQLGYIEARIQQGCSPLPVAGEKSFKEEA